MRFLRAVAWAAALAAVATHTAAATGALAGEPAASPLPPLEIAPLRSGLVGWKRAGPASVFRWVPEEATLEIRGQPGDGPGRFVYERRAWEEFEATFRVRKGTARVRVLLVPAGDGPAVPVEMPKGATASDRWTEVALVVRAGRAVLSAGRRETSVAVPAETRLSLGFEADAAGVGAITDLRLVRRYEDRPQVCEEGFRPLFDGKSLGAWTPAGPEDVAAFDAVGGILRGAVRTRDASLLVLTGERAAAYEFRFRALWGTTGLTFVADDPPALARPDFPGRLTLLLGDMAEEDDVSDVVITVRPDRWSVDVNGRRRIEERPEGGATKRRGTGPILAFLVRRGERIHLRDLRIREIPAHPGAEGAPPDAEVR